MSIKVFKNTNVSLQRGYRCQWLVEGLQNATPDDEGKRIMYSPEFSLAYNEGKYWTISVELLDDHQVCIWVECDGPSLANKMCALAKLHVCNDYLDCLRFTDYNSRFFSNVTTEKTRRVDSIEKFLICCHFGTKESNLTANEAIANLQEYPKPIFKSYAAFLYENAAFSDLTIKVGDVSFPCHKFVLGASSIEFSRMLLRDINKNVIEMNDVKPEEMRAFFEFLYREEFNDVHKEKLLYMADKYDIKELKARCIEAMIPEIKVENVAHYVTLCNFHKCPQLEAKCEEFIRKNILLVKDEDFMDFAADDLLLPETPE